MQIIKFLWKSLDFVMGGIWGLTVIEFISLFRKNLLEGVDSLVTTLTAIAGLVYFILKGIDNHKMNKLNREEKKIENLMKKEELEGMEIDNEKKNLMFELR